MKRGKLFGIDVDMDDKVGIYKVTRAKLVQALKEEQAAKKKLQHGVSEEQLEEINSEATKAFDIFRASFEFLEEEDQDRLQGDFAVLEEAAATSARFVKPA